MLAIHGGAGIISRDKFSDSEIDKYKQSLGSILNHAQKLYQKEASALEICLECTVKFEDDPLFNAGRGSVLNEYAEVEMDASVMEGKSVRGAGLSGLSSIKNPILGANKLLEYKKHTLISSNGAEEFLKNFDLETCPQGYFKTEKRQKQFENFLKTKKVSLDHGGASTVGVVCLDRQGDLAAATSTGGMTGKSRGRISDSAIIGAGTYANNETLAISATGTGDHFIQESFAYDVHAQMKYLKRSLTESIQQSLKLIESRGGYGGAIAISSEGEIAMPFNSGGMFRASLDKNGNRTIAVFSEQESR